MDEDLKAKLLAPRLPEADVYIPGVATFRVRGLTRAEIKAISQGTDDGKDMEPWVLSRCLVYPTITEREAEQWLAVAPFGEIEKLTEKINEISGIAKYANREAYKSLREHSGA